MSMGPPLRPIGLVLAAAVIGVTNASSLEPQVDTSPPLLYTYDAHYTTSGTATHGYEEQHLIAVLGGLVNRRVPSLFVQLETADATWLSRLTAPGGWLANTTLTSIPNLDALLTTFNASYGGVVLYDPAVWATSAVATTIAAADDLLPVCYRPGDPTSLLSRIVQGGLRLPVVFSLVGMFNGSASGSAKADAYAWAIEHYLGTGRSDGTSLGYYVDSFWASRNDTSGWEKNTVSNMDYFVSRRAFFFDLSVWDDEAPVDDPTQRLGTDLASFKAVLAAAYAQTGGASMIHIGGFTPWAYKYVAPNGKHAGVETEWATSK